MTDKDFIDLQAQFSLQQYLLEVVFTNVATSSTAEQWNGMVSGVIHQIRFDGTLVGQADDESASQLHQAMLQRAQRFFAKIEERVAGSQGTAGNQSSGHRQDA